MNNDQKIRKTLESTQLEALKSLLYLRFNITSPSEVSLLNELLIVSGGNPLRLEPNIRADVSKQVGINPESIGTMLGRVEKKKVLHRNGKLIVFSPIFNNWGNTSEVLFKIKE